MILINLNLNSPMWLVATALPSVAGEHFPAPQEVLLDGVALKDGSSPNWLKKSIAGIHSLDFRDT